VPSWSQEGGVTRASDALLVALCRRGAPADLDPVPVKRMGGGISGRELAQTPALEPRFTPGFAGLLCSRALVRVGNELNAMVIVFGVAPKDWPPTPEMTQELAASLKIPAGELGAVFERAFTLTPDQQKTVLVTIQRIADILAHIGDERMALLGRLSDIARLSTV